MGRLYDRLQAVWTAVERDRAYHMSIRKHMRKPEATDLLANAIMMLAEDGKLESYNAGRMLAYLSIIEGKRPALLPVAA